eukprot:2469953-Pyramimonas_sp.AAC.1
MPASCRVQNWRVVDSRWPSTAIARGFSQPLEVTSCSRTRTCTSGQARPAGWSASRRSCSRS